MSDIISCLHDQFTQAGLETYPASYMDEEGTVRPALVMKPLLIAIEEDRLVISDTLMHEDILLPVNHIQSARVVNVGQAYVLVIRTIAITYTYTIRRDHAERKD